MIQRTRDPERKAAGTIEDALQLVRSKAAALRFGTITLTLHEGRPTQVEVNERCRFVP